MADESTEYMERLCGYSDGAAIISAMTIAKDLGFLQLFIEPHDPMTTEEIASRTNLKERYVRELLGCLVTGKVIEINAESDKYFLSKVLQPNLQFFCVSLDLMKYAIERKEEIKECTRMDGPNGFSGQSKPGYGEALKKLRSTNIDGLIEREMYSNTPDIKLQLEKGIKFLEVGCGFGPVIIKLAEQYPNSTFVAGDYSPEALVDVDRTIKEKGLTNITTCQADLHCLPEDWEENFDIAYTRDTIHDIGDPPKGIQQMGKVTKKGGITLIVEIGLKGDSQLENIGCLGAPVTYYLSSSICIPESLVQGGAGLGCTSGINLMKRLIGQSLSQHKSIEDFVLDMTSVKFVCRK